MTEQDYDRRITAARPDLAASHLRDRIRAERYAEGQPLKVVVPRTPIKGRPDPSASYTSELLFGEDFTAYEIVNGWAWGQVGHDGYVGYVAAEALGARGEPSHVVAALSTHVYPAPDLKLPPLMPLYLGSRVAVASNETEKGFLELASGGWIFAAHLRPGESYATDFVREAERFLHAPYHWGGRTVAGIDCSGLVQVALAATGVFAPRDSDQQLRAIGSAAAPEAPRRRGDIVYFPGHVGIMLDETQLIHANATYMAVTINPLAEVLETVARTTDKPPLSGVRRP